MDTLKHKQVDAPYHNYLLINFGQKAKPALRKRRILFGGVSLHAPDSSISMKGYLQSQKGEKTMFKRNEGILDRIVRVTLALILLPTGIFLLGGLQGSVLGLVVAGFGGLALITGITGFCPTYVLFGINTLEKEKEFIARCRSMMAGFQQASASQGDAGAGQVCETCLPSIVKTHDQQV